MNRDIPPEVLQLQRQIRLQLAAASADPHDARLLIEALDVMGVASDLPDWLPRRALAESEVRP